jgi:hypothetical protein
MAKKDFTQADPGALYQSIAQATAEKGERVFTEEEKTEMLQGMIDAQDNANLAKKFEELILMCYGEKSDDGMYFMKSPEISHKFRCTGAYNTLFLEFLKGGEQYTADFINAVIPADLAQQIAAEKGVEGPTLVKE